VNDMYSQYNLLEADLKALEERSFIDRIITALTKGKRLTFSLEVPNDLYQRAEIICDDVVQMREEDRAYGQHELAEHVFLEFLDEVRKHDSNVGAIYTRLKVRKQQFPMVNDSPLIPAKSKTGISVKVDREDVLRAEVLLKDLSHFVPDHNLQVEELIEIVYLDFLLEYSKGRRNNVLKAIVEEID
jgi:hypothetical protein